MTLQRPFDLTKATAESGHWRWVSLPQAVTINGHGNFLDCALIGGLGDVNGTALSETTCNVTDYTVPPGGPHFMATSSLSCMLKDAWAPDGHAPGALLQLAIWHIHNASESCLF